MTYDSQYRVVVHELHPNDNTKHIKWDDGEEQFRNEKGLFHRLDGPAITYPDGNVEFWLNGEKVNSLEELIIKNIIE